MTLFKEAADIKTSKMLDLPNLKINMAVENIYKIELENKKDKLTQLVFYDLSTPRNDGTFNVYDDIKNKLIALHHLDCPLRLSDIEQREGRILRQGNQNKEVEIYRYVTEGIFDAYSYQLIQTKSNNG